MFIEEFAFSADNGEDVDGLPTEGVEIVCFDLVCVKILSVKQSVALQPLMRLRVYFV